MAYKSKFLHFKTKASYEAERAKTTAGTEERKVFDAYISFIDEGPTICTWGKEYQCDANSLSVLPQELTTEEQNQVFKNLGWNVHIISQSDIDAGSSPSNEEKAKRLEATALLVKETSNIYLRGNDASNNHYFFKVNSSSQIELLRLSITTGIIYRINTQFIDVGSIRYDRTQSLTEDQKALVRENIDAVSKEDTSSVTIDITELTPSVDDYNRVVEAINSNKRIFLDFGYNTKVACTVTNNAEEEGVMLSAAYTFSEDTENPIITIYTVILLPTGEKQLIPSAIGPQNTTPNPASVNGSAGTSTQYSRGDHTHPAQVNITGNAATATTATNLASAPSFINNGNTIKITVGNKTSTEFTIPYASKTSSAETLMYGRNIFLDGDVTGSTTESFNGSKNVTINTTISTINAEKLTGIINVDRLPEIPIEKLPAGALERMFIVESQTAAIDAVKAGTIQEGDVVQIGNGGLMYFCIDDAATTFGNAFKEFTAGSATSVPWSGVTGKPSLSLRSLQINAVDYQVYSNVATSIPMIYAPTEIGTSGQILQSTGNGAPKWINQSAITAGQANQVLNPFVLKINNGSAEDTSVYTFNGSAGKVLNFVSGSNIILTPTQNKLTISAYIPVATSSAYGGIQIGYTTSGKNYAVQLSNGKAYVNVPWTDTNTNYYPTTFTWANGTTAGPTGSLTGSGMSTVSFGAIPSASATQSGVVTTGDQTFGGIKTIDTINVTNINEATPGEGFWIGYNTEGVIRIGKDGDYDFGTSGGTYSGTANTAKRLLNSLQFSNGQSFNGSSAVTIDLPEIPVALPNPYALTINGQSYTGSSAVSISTSKPLSVRMLTSSTVDAGYSYSCGTSKAISTLNGFSSTNPDSVIISSAKLTFTASNVIKMDGLDDLSGTWYIYCLSYMANSKIAVNGAVYA